MDYIPIHASTDGACRGNPGKGGWGWVYYSALGKDTGPTYSGYGGDPKTTNNKMELTAVIQLFKSVVIGVEMTIFSDSQYVLKGLVKDGNGDLNIKGEYSGWMQNWIKSGWKKPAKNVDLWQTLNSEIQRHIDGGSRFHLRWVKGHSGDIGNDLADALANKGIDEL